MESENEEEIKQMVRQSFLHPEPSDPKSSYGSSVNQRYLCIQDLLKANEIDLGHYTRCQSIGLAQNCSYAEMDKLDTSLTI